MGDLGCDWYCDDCGAHMNGQPGFNAGDTWVCAECGACNDVSESNIIDDDDDDDGYFGSYQYYKDEEKRLAREEEDLRELGIDMWD